MTAGELENLRTQLLRGRVVDFTLRGEDYLFQQENNKGWDYMSIWRTSGRHCCLGRALFDILDGISQETVTELLNLKCLDGHSVLELQEEIQLVEYGVPTQKTGGAL